MRRRLMRAYGMAALGAGMVLGCQSTPWRHSPAHDPVLLSKQSVDGKAEAGGPVLLAEAEPAPPPVPPDALVLAQPVVTPQPNAGPQLPSLGPQPAEAQAAVAPPDTRTKPEAPVARPEPPAVVQAPAGPAAPKTVVGRAAERPAGGSAPVSLIGTAKTAVPVTPAVRTVEPAAVPAAVAPRPEVVGNYGHAPNYAWLQGVLARHYQGHLELRYADPRTEDHWGGKVCLEPDPRLAQFADGDVILVEGELLPDRGRGLLGGWSYRHYRISQALLIHRGK